MRLTVSDLSFREVPLRSPFRFGASTMTDLHTVTVAMTVAEGSRTGRGTGAMTLGNSWSWPDAPDQVSKDAMERLVRRLAQKFDGLEVGESVIGASLELKRIALQTRQDLALEPGAQMPALCALVSFSAFDIALFDAWGHMNAANSFDLLCSSAMEDKALSNAAGIDSASLKTVLTSRPAASLNVFHAVGGLDPLTPADVTQPVGDGLPENLQDWVKRDGVRCFKIKLRGNDTKWDYERVTSVSRACREVLGGREPAFSLDFNEQCPSGDSGAEFLARLARDQPGLFSRIEFCEQPMPRTFRASPQEDVRAMARYLPVCLDEGLVDLEAFEAGIATGYNGICLKACKGLGFSLVAAAAARGRNLFTCFQDLTCTGRAYLASVALAARVGVTSLEANGRQFCPAISTEFATTHGELFNVADGRIITRSLTAPGIS